MTVRVPTLGRYRLDELIGHGGMAVVYRGYDVELERVVAVKLLADNLVADAPYRQRFLREARLAARLAHPNVVQVYDAGEGDGRPYIVMEYVEGETLADRLAREGKLEPPTAVALAVAACAGLQAAHERELVHRDIKPHNLLVRHDGVLKIADFGIARSSQGTILTEVGSVLGTAAYLAPEQAAGGEVSTASDIYSLGVVLYEMLAGRPPQTVETLAELLVRQYDEAVPAIRESSPEVPVPLEALVMRCIARDPKYRPASAAALADALAASLPEDAAAAHDGTIRVRRCPNPQCDDGSGEPASNILVPALSVGECGTCSGRVWPTDVLRLHEAFNPEGSNLEVLGRTMLAVEHLVLAGVALTILDDAPQILPQCAFITDGSLALFGEVAPMRLGLLGVWQFIARELRARQLELPVVLGIEKTGFAADHLRALRQQIPNGTLMRLTDEYLADRLRARSWKETYYGRKFFYVSEVGQALVITVLPLEAGFSPYPSDATTDRSDPAHYATMKRTLMLLDQIGTQLYDNALIPVALAHSFAAYPLTTSTQVLRLLTERTLGTATAAANSH